MECVVHSNIRVFCLIESVVHAYKRVSCWVECVAHAYKISYSLAYRFILYQELTQFI